MKGIPDRLDFLCFPFLSFLLTCPGGKRFLQDIFNGRFGDPVKVWGFFWYNFLSDGLASDRRGKDISGPAVLVTLSVSLHWIDDSHLRSWKMELYIFSQKKSFLRLPYLLSEWLLLPQMRQIKPQQRCSTPIGSCFVAFPDCLWSHKAFHCCLCKKCDIENLWNKISFCHTYLMPDFLCSLTDT